ncbi:MAG: SH3 domain-containing protein [Nitriliruptorales bacterium]|nr:SH3 domain-containing protein [Nitriliruptorales bacterium]
MRPFVVAAVATLALAGCGGDAAAPEPTPSSPAASPATNEPSPHSTEVPGQPFGRAQAGAAYLVVGVAHDDTLNVRNGPGPGYDILTEIPPTGQAVATGRDTIVDSGLWFEVDVAAVRGWASSSFLALAGATADITADVVADAGGTAPSAATLEELGLLVADLRASTDPPSNVVIVAGPNVGDVGEITVDVVGLGDDAVKGERLAVFATPTDSGFTLMSVEMTLLCDRGVDSGLCV